MRKKSRMPVLYALLFCLSLGGAMFTGKTVFHSVKAVQANPESASYETLLTDKEQKEWSQKEADPDHMYLQMNQAVKVDAQGNADIHLVHPPYSPYYCQVKINLNGQGDLLYDSGNLRPGTVVQETQITQRLPEGIHKATAVFQYLDDEETVVSTYAWTLSIEAQ